MLRRAFKSVKDRRKISNAALHRITGISESHLSAFLNPNRSTDITTEKLSQLIEAMEEISPGAKYDFAKTIVSESSFVDEIIETIPHMSSDELSTIVLAISKWLKSSQVKKNIPQNIHE